MDDTPKFREVKREVLLVVVATVVRDPDELVDDHPLDPCDTHNWRQVRYHLGITSMFRSATEGAAELA